MKKEQIKGSLSLFLAAIIWGAAFVAQSVGMDYVGPFTFNCVRTLIGGIVLIPCIAFLNRGKVRKKTYFTEKKRLLLGGICCGVALATGSTLQQFGIMYTTVGKAGFITAFYIIIVPILGLFLGKKCGLSVWISVVIALAGLYLEFGLWNNKILFSCRISVILEFGFGISVFSASGLKGSDFIFSSFYCKQKNKLYFTYPSDSTCF